MSHNNVTEKALKLLQKFPRVTIKSAEITVYNKRKESRLVGQRAYPIRQGRVKSSWENLKRYVPVGYKEKEAPFYHLSPVMNYYKDVLHRRSYPPYSLYDLQLNIDTGKLNINEPIDLASLRVDGDFKLDPLYSEYGVQLTDEGIDCFKAQINIEVQHASEQVIAAIERNGGVITTAYYDLQSVTALSNPQKFFQKGEPIPKRLLPPPNAIEYYLNPKNRGYLADPEQIAKERFILAQKYGYELPDIDKDPKKKMLTLQKDPRQVFFGLEPGWLVVLKDKEILRPIDPEWREYYEKI